MPKAAQLGVHFKSHLITSRDVLRRGTQLRTGEWEKKERKRLKPSAQQDSNPCLLDHVAWAEPLCHNRCETCTKLKLFDTLLRMMKSKQKSIFWGEKNKIRKIPKIDLRSISRVSTSKTFLSKVAATSKFGFS